MGWSDQYEFIPGHLISVVNGVPVVTNSYLICKECSKGRTTSDDHNPGWVWHAANCSEYRKGALKKHLSELELEMAEMQRDLEQKAKQVDRILAEMEEAGF